MGDKRTADDVEAILGSNWLPGGEQTWLDLVKGVARLEGVDISAVCSRDRHPATVRARRRAWRLLRELGYSLEEVAMPWGVHHTTVMAATPETRRRAA